MKMFIVISSLLFSSMAFADFGACNDLFPKKKAPVVNTKLSKDSRQLCMKEFAILYSVTTKTPVYTIEKLSYLRQGGNEKRQDNFHEEYRLKPNERSTLKDYARSGYDRGHQVPAADMKHNELAMSDSFSLANMVPQAPKNNRGVWAKSVEAATRKYVARAAGDVYVFTGGHYEDGYKTIGANKVGVPTYLWKLVYDSQTKRSWAYWVANTDDAKMSKPLTYEEFVAKTGLRLLD